MLAILLINIAHFMNAFIPELCWNFPFYGRRKNNSSKFPFEHGEGDECFNDTRTFTEQIKIYKNRRTSSEKHFCSPVLSFCSLTLQKETIFFFFFSFS